MWKVTDSEIKLKDFTQFIRKVGPNVYEVVEHDDLGDVYVARQAIIYLNNYTKDEKLEILAERGYYGLMDNETIAKCIAEVASETVIHSEDWEDVVQWEESRGIYLDELLFMNEDVQAKVLEYLNEQYPDITIERIVDYADTKGEDYYKVKCDIVEHFASGDIRDTNNFIVHKGEIEC